MDYDKLTIIGERINPGFKSSLALFENSDIAGIQQLAAKQVANGAKFLNVNTGDRALSDPDFLIKVINGIQAVVEVPLSFDFPNYEVQELCFKNYRYNADNSNKPIINSISELRWEMTELLDKYPSRVLLMASERLENGASIANKTAKEVFDTTCNMVKRLQDEHGVQADDIYVDVSVCPVAVDMEGLIRMAIDAIKLIGESPALSGIHLSVGLSNISIMVPPKAADGSPLKLALESAFLTKTVPLGLDTIIGTPGRDYQMLPDDHFVLQGVEDFLQLDDVEAIMRLQQLFG